MLQLYRRVLDAVPRQDHAAGQPWSATGKVRLPIQDSRLCVHARVCGWMPSGHQLPLPRASTELPRRAPLVRGIVRVEPELFRFSSQHHGVSQTARILFTMGVPRDRYDHGDEPCRKSLRNLRGTSVLLFRNAVPSADWEKPTGNPQVADKYGRERAKCAPDTDTSNLARSWEEIGRLKGAIRPC